MRFVGPDQEETAVAVDPAAFVLIAKKTPREAGFIR
jgi:hypothetical protein